MKTTLQILKNSDFKVYAKMMEFDGTSVPVISLPDADQLAYPGKKMKNKCKDLAALKAFDANEVIIESFSYDNEHGTGTSLRYYVRDMEGWEAL
jgi:hypothetical protein